MARQTYLWRRGAVYYARLDTPADLIETVGRSTLKKSLKTKDAETAKKRLWPVISEWRNEFDDLRARKVLDNDHKAAAVWDHYTDMIERDEERRQHLPTDQDIATAEKAAVDRVQREGIDITDPLAVLDVTVDLQLLHDERKGADSMDAAARRAKLADLQKHLSSGATYLIDHEVDAFLTKHNLVAEPGSPDRDALARQMMRAEIEALRRTLERDKGDYGGAPQDPIVKPANSIVRKVAKPGESITEVFEKYAQENPKGVKPDTLNTARRDVGLFVQVVGKRFPVSEITKKHVREWKELLLAMPVKAAETKTFQGMSLTRIVEKNKTVQKPTITKRTVNRHIAALGAFCKWAVTNGWLEDNPVTGMALPKEDNVSTLPFTVDQMNKLFASPLFTGCQGDDRPSGLRTPGNVRLDDYRYWVPLIMLYSGARPGEIAQLDVADVRQEHGQWIIHITDEGSPGKSVKTKGSIRILPIHDQLIKLGFIDYHKRMSAAGHIRLFPTAERDERGQMIADYSREFPRYLAAIDVKQGKQSLYSFRHGAADALRRAGYLDEQFGFILGHGKATTTGRYGQIPQGMLDQRVTLVNSINYPGLKLDQLFTV